MRTKWPGSSLGADKHIFQYILYPAVFPCIVPESIQQNAASRRNTLFPKGLAGLKDHDLVASSSSYMGKIIKREKDRSKKKKKDKAGGWRAGLYGSNCQD
jgi:hypothetical protein